MRVQAKLAEQNTYNSRESLKVLIKGNGVLVGVVEACHDSTLLVFTYSLLKEVCLAPTPWQDSHDKPVTWLFGAWHGCLQLHVPLPLSNTFRHEILHAAKAV